MTSRGMISARQRTNSYRPNGDVAQHVIDSTIEFPAMQGREIARLIAHDVMTIGDLTILGNEHFYLLKSKVADCYYAVIEGSWECSATDSATNKLLVVRAKAYYQELVERARAKQDALAA